MRNPNIKQEEINMVKRLTPTKDRISLIEKKKELKAIRGGITNEAPGPSPCAGFCNSYCGTESKNDDKMYTSNKAYR